MSCPGLALRHTFLKVKRYCYRYLLWEETFAHLIIVLSSGFYRLRWFRYDRTLLGSLFGCSSTLRQPFW